MVNNKIIQDALRHLEQMSKLPVMDYSGTYFDKLSTIREYYNIKIPEYISEYDRTGRQRFNPYPFDWAQILTPIEFSAWTYIRSMGIPLYPQLPVGKFYLDFGSPFLKIGLELDGKEYHDLSKDYERDLKLRSFGWTIIRINGKEMERSFYLHEPCFNDDVDSYLSSLREWYLNTGAGIIDALRIVYWPKSNFFRDDYINNYIYSFCKETLKKHNILTYA